jgi:phosphatidylinositol-3-phosphatase
MRVCLRWAAVLLILLALTSCGTVTSVGVNPAPGVSISRSAIDRVALVVEENRSYGDVIGNTTDAPYMNQLASQYSLATQYFANTHPSIGDYFMLTTGQVVTNDDSFVATVDVDNIVRELNAAGKTWKSYAESLPSVGYTGGDSGPYVKRHNPLAYFSDVANDSTQASRLVPFTQFATDLAANALPNFSFITPNVNDDAHNGTLAAADSWLQANIGPLLADPHFQQSGLLVVLFDEGEMTDFANGGGHIPVILIGPTVKKNYQSLTFYQHQSTLRLILETLGVHSLPGAAATATQMGEFFE